MTGIGKEEGNGRKGKRKGKKMERKGKGGKIVRGTRNECRCKADSTLIWP